MPTIPQSPRVVKPAPILLSMEAVKQGRASWRWTKPIDEATAVQLGDAMWLSQAPRPHREALAAARDEALGPVDGPCCTPHEEPCISCSPPDLYPDDIAYEPTAADLEWYHGLCRERDDRLRAERIEAGPTFQEKLYAEVHRLCDSLDDDIHGLGEFIAELAREAVTLEATNWEQFLDRRQAMLDAQL